MHTLSFARPAALLSAVAFFSFSSAAAGQTAVAPAPGDADPPAPLAAAPVPVPDPGPPPAAEPPEEVRVVGAKTSRVAGSVHVIGKKQLERFEHDDPHAIVTAVPGVYVRGEDGFGLRPNIGIRGAASDRSKKITLMEDGVLFGPAPYSAPAAY